MVATQPDAWWRHAVIYQLYVRSFADANGDGVGDLAGVRSRLGYLRDLGVDAIWFNPWYASPLHDGGYDVADYRAIEPSFGTLSEAEALIAEALDLGIRTIIDIVPNHVSDQHPWFIEAHAGGPGSPMRLRFWFRSGRGAGGEQPPNDWLSHFGDSAWTRTKNPDGTRGDWFLHLFAPAQPDLNWEHPAVREEHEAILRFWFDRGAAGIRIDSAALAIKDPALPDLGDVPPVSDHPFVDRDEIHDVYRSWRTIADSYDPPRALIGEVWLEDRQRFARYLRPDELHGAFNFDFLACPWEADALRACIDDTLASHAPADAPPSWVLSNHDVTRVVTRYGRVDTTFSFAAKRVGTPTDLQLGTRRARAAALLGAALPGTLYVYQGEELGLPEVEDLPPEHLQDPMHFQSGGTDPGRDGCRVPLPWDGSQSPYGFGPAGSTPWLPQPASWATLSVAAEQDDPTSMLALYRHIIAVRRRRLVGATTAIAWLDAEPDVLAFARHDIACIVNLSSGPVQLPAGTVLLTSGPLDGDRLPVDSAAWVHLDNHQPDPEQ
ncbi:MAG: glycoside hydrolase family 13 protein [Ilumatobacteraceae bacterium]